MSKPRQPAPRVRPARTPEEDPWLFTAEELDETPSRLAGVPRAVEDSVHSRSTRYITECSRELRIPQLTTLVAATFLRRFYMLESLTDHSTPAVAAACLFLACKVQETHKRLRDFIYWTVKIRTRDSDDYADGVDLYEDSAMYDAEKTAMLAKEADVLRVLNFDLTIDQPYKHLLAIGKYFIPTNPLMSPGRNDSHSTNHSRATPYTSGEIRQRNKEVMQHAWNFVNDSSGSYVHVRFDAREIATAALFIAARLHKLDLPTTSSQAVHANDRHHQDHQSRQPSSHSGKTLDNPASLHSAQHNASSDSRAESIAWYEFYSCNLEHIEEICNAMLNTYDRDSSVSL